jgi:putative SOS response-associated peptidase YedK
MQMNPKNASIDRTLLRWIECSAIPDHLKGLLRPYDPSQTEAYPVTTYANRSVNQGPKCIEPLQMTA